MLDRGARRERRDSPGLPPLPWLANCQPRCADARATLIVTLMAQQGLRCVEAARLEMADLDWANGLMPIIGKGGHHRVLPIFGRDGLGSRPLPRGASSRCPAPRPVLPAAKHGAASRHHFRDGGGVDVSGRIKRALRDGVSAHALVSTMATDSLRRAPMSETFGTPSSTTEVYLPSFVGGLKKAMSGRS